MKLIHRAQWGARAPKNYTRLASTKGVKVHYVGETISPALTDDHDRCTALVKSIQRDHMDGNGWADIAYNALVCPHGYVYEGRGPHRLCAANGPGLNTDHYAVCGLVGDKGLVVPSDAMLNGLRDAIEWLREAGDAGSQIKGHRDGYSTSCPGDRLYAWVKKGAPRPGGKPTPPGKAPAWPGVYLKVGSTGTSVRTWQAQMHKRGWTITVDGVYGDESRRVCIAFQKEKHLNPDGIVGPDTWRATWEAPIA
ncbi:peptidoglycan recognition protein family protein [Actinomadura rupiterrae]|uniref:peptidoglycan recognition protein family protein n=1 Tax=Actinomadura rupiterrae TaxID=559627 RepID=UPI0020A25057|nr:peptidoglycan-binding domain-containing protein [Actinomadura rupiterrae]MCP2341508.1 murein L,D-transpeptidase YcbB/YkuD [Actinomadura rupiterrae]